VGTVADLEFPPKSSPIFFVRVRLDTYELRRVGPRRHTAGRHFQLHKALLLVEVNLGSVITLWKSVRPFTSFLVVAGASQELGRTQPGGRECAMGRAEGRRPVWLRGIRRAMIGKMPAVRMATRRQAEFSARTDVRPSTMIDRPR